MALLNDQIRLTTHVNLYEELYVHVNFVAMLSTPN